MPPYEDTYRPIQTHPRRRCLSLFWQDRHHDFHIKNCDWLSVEIVSLTNRLAIQTPLLHRDAILMNYTSKIQLNDLVWNSTLTDAILMNYTSKVQLNDFLWNSTLTDHTFPNAAPDKHISVLTGEKSIYPDTGAQKTHIANDQYNFTPLKCQQHNHATGASNCSWPKCQCHFSRGHRRFCPTDIPLCKSSLKPAIRAIVCEWVLLHWHQIYLS